VLLKIREQSDCWKDIHKGAGYPRELYRRMKLVVEEGNVATVADECLLLISIVDRFGKIQISCGCGILV